MKALREPALWGILSATALVAFSYGVALCLVEFSRSLP